jgi:hypothetical protein
LNCAAQHCVLIANTSVIGLMRCLRESVPTGARFLRMSQTLHRRRVL